MSMLTGLALVAALLCAAVMGLAIQRGSTCTVAAVDEWRNTRRLTRLGAMLEASLWVCAGLLLARHWGQAVPPLPGYALSLWTFSGAALLGAGAVLNRACVVGTVARLGSGQWAFAATPVGFFVGCLSVDRIFAAPASTVVGAGAPLGAVPSWMVWAVMVAAAWRLAAVFRGRGADGMSAWSPHVATLVIALAFVVLLVVAGPWAYSDVLAELARGMAGSLPARIALCAALLAGALAGGRMAGTLRWHRVSLGDVLRCAGGGLLMGWGSRLIPGSNDSLLLLGLPMLWPYAWAAFATMLVVVGASLHLTRRPVA